MFIFIRRIIIIAILVFLWILIYNIFFTQSVFFEEDIQWEVVEHTVEDLEEETIEAPKPLDDIDTMQEVNEKKGTLKAIRNHRQIIKDAIIEDEIVIEDEQSIEDNNIISVDDFLESISDDTNQKETINIEEKIFESESKKEEKTSSSFNWLDKEPTLYEKNEDKDNYETYKTNDKIKKEQQEQAYQEYLEELEQYDQEMTDAVFSSLGN